MKKIWLFLLFFMLILPFNWQSYNALAENTNLNYLVSANYAYIYAEPNFSAQKLEKLSNQTKVLLEVESGNPVEYKSDDFVFYKVSNYNNGYIFCDFVTPENLNIQYIPNFNAKTNSSCNLYINENNEVISLEKNHPLFLYEGFNKKEDFNAVAVLIDNEIIYGFVQTEYINPNGINPVLITCIIIIIALLGIIFAWLFIKKRK